VRGIWSLPKAAPALFRHLGAYIDLAALDLDRTRREITAQIVAWAIIAVCIFFLLVMICLAVLALTWNTPYRLAAIAWMSGGFLLIAVVALIYRSNVARSGSPFLGDVKKEWQEDRVILERIFFPEKHE
jgi:uncharacterized membrane protein YqjE